MNIIFFTNARAPYRIKQLERISEIQDNMILFWLLNKAVEVYNLSSNNRFSSPLSLYSVYFFPR